MLLRFASTLCFLLAFACNKKVTETASPTEPMTVVTYGELTEIPLSGGLKIAKTAGSFYFVEVVSDSRCPKGVDCVRAGEAIVRLRLPDGESPEVTISADGKNRAGFAIPDGAVEILGLTPYPEARVRIDPASYRLKVRVTKAAVQ